jgi:hypothetical protein
VGLPALPGAPGVPGLPALPGVPGVGVPALPGAAAALPPLAVQPNAAFLGGPVPTVPGIAPPALGAPLQMPGVVQVPPLQAAPVRQMTALAGGATYEAFIQAGYTDAILVQRGFMLP